MYFSDRELGARPRIEEDISLSVWGGLVAIINSRISDGSFGYIFPEECPDGGGNICGCDSNKLSLSLAAEIPGISLPLDTSRTPPTLTVLDFLEFCHRAIGKPVKTDYHSFFRHHHLHFEPEEGQSVFRNDIERIFSRNGIAYELRSNGLIVRLAPEGLRETLASAIFRTGDSELDSLLNTARVKYLSPNPTIRQESLEKLWDAWERLKTIEPGRDKRASAAALLSKAAPESTFREALDKEASELTRIGNTFRIRHSETTQVPLGLNEHVDYLFHRLFALIMLFLRTTGRCRQIDALLDNDVLLGITAFNVSYAQFQQLSLEWFNECINHYAKIIGIQKIKKYYADGRTLKLITCMALREAGERHHDNAGGSRKLSAVAAGHTMEVKERHYEKVGEDFEQVHDSYRKFHPAFVENW